MGSNITMVITSCDRHDLLRKTLDTFITMNCGGGKPDATIIIEDSTTPMPEWLKENIHYYSANVGKVTWIQNDCRMGQIYSIDRAYAQVKTDLIFHCEDDWLFNEGDFMNRSKEILARYPEIIQVSLRGDSGWHQLIDWPPYEGFKIAMPGWHGCWGGLSFNPGLRRLSDYKRLGSYGRHTSYGTSGLGHEKELSIKLLDLGYRIADLNRPIVHHIGGARSRAIEPLAALPKVLIAIPVCHKYAYGKWESGDSPYFDPAIAYNGVPYGQGIHISAKNDRVDALRATWINDIKPFEAHVEYKFFYGDQPEGILLPRIPAEDEVFLRCPDDYEHLPDKTVAICRWAVAQDKYDYVFKCDDDTGVYVDRLIQELMTNRFDYAGFTHSGVCTGGTGYWLSRRAYKEVGRNGLQDHWAEDVTVGKIMNAANIYAVHLDTHRTGASAHWFWKDGYDPKVDMDGISTFHAVQPADMRAWHAEISKQKKAKEK